ncbi:MAG TPA: hypothetical protein VK791_07925 [bacterium]|nr:hypothetical protein [bacterium]
MPTKRILFLILISLWVTEPFLSVAALKTQTHHICQTCGMEDMCGDVCCCADTNAICGHHAGVYPAGCTPDSARQLFFAQSAEKFIPSVHPEVFRVDLRLPLAIAFNFCPSPTSEIFTPPPKSDHFAS